MTDPKADKASPAAIAVATRSRRIQEILAGSLPLTSERLVGYPPLRGSEYDDRRVYLQSILVAGVLTDPDAIAALDHARADGSIPALLAAKAALTSSLDGEQRLGLYLALAGHCESRTALIIELLSPATWNWRSTYDTVYGRALGIGLLVSRAEDVDDILVAGLRQMRSDGTRATEIYDAEQSALPADGVDDGTAIDAALADIKQLVDENQAAIVTTPAPGGLVVVPTLDLKGATGARKEIVKSYEALSGQPLPIVEPSNLPLELLVLRHRFPHFHAEIDLILRQRRPLLLLLVGSPGCGKTALARAIADALCVPSIVYGAGGASDSAFAGTSAQWSTARASTPLQLVHRYRISNPLIVLDELEKAGTSRHNGSLVDALLSFLEPSSARRVLDPALEVEVDLSAVSYIATANSLEGVPVPLRDRLKVIRMPDPEWQHVGDLTRSIMDDLAAERDLDRRWIGELAQDELELVRQAWPGGSIRRLRRVVELLIDGRDNIIGRA